MLYLQAMNVPGGGGAVLLQSLLKALAPNREVVVFVDVRLDLPPESAEGLTLIRVKPTIFHRALAEWRLSKSAKTDDLVLCFGNLPPLMKIKAKVVVFVHNRLLVEPKHLNRVSIPVRLRLRLERLWLRGLSARVDKFLVQTASMRSLLANYLESREADVEICSFVSHAAAGSGLSAASASEPAKKLFDYDFIYPASGDDYKNHRVLIEAWKILGSRGCYPSLCVTVDPDRFSDLCRWIDDEAQRYRLNIRNLGCRPHSEIINCYMGSRALVYPSLVESFGLPLIEARDAGMPIIAPELDYVRDVVIPDEVFDPASPRSLARAVLRFLGEMEKPAVPVHPVDFIDRVRSIVSGEGK
jgi:glycosyltransferase involved in cell wall biosynthesis